MIGAYDEFSFLLISDASIKRKRHKSAMSIVTNWRCLHYAVKAKVIPIVLKMVALSKQDDMDMRGEYRLHPMPLEERYAQPPP